MPWLIWATYNPFSKISENKMGNRSENKIGCFTSYFLSYIPKFQKMQNTHVILRGRVTYLIKSKLIVFKLIIDRKQKQKSYYKG